MFLIALIASIPSFLLTRMPSRPARQVSDRYARQIVQFSPLSFQCLVGVFGLTLWPEHIFLGFVLAWIISMLVCWWLPIRQRELERRRKRAARAARKAAKAEHDQARAESKRRDGCESS